MFCLARNESIYDCHVVNLNSSYQHAYQWNYLQIKSTSHVSQSQVGSQSPSQSKQPANQSISPPAICLIEVATERQVLPLSGHAAWAGAEPSSKIAALHVHKCA